MTTKIFRKVMMSAVTILLPVIVAAQESNDSIAIHELDEIVVQAPKVIRKADMDVLYPSESAVENSKNGMQLLNNLMIPTLTVNDVMGSISAGGQAVQVRINGREATVEQVRSLLPETIKRVEWIDNPGLRYNGAAYVLNIIVTNPSAGGSLMLSAQPALTDRFGIYSADVKLNTGKSQWSVGTTYKMTDNIKAHRDYHETFAYPDGVSLTRTELPLGGSVNDSRASAWLTYSYIKSDTTVFYASFKGFRNISAKERYEGMLRLGNDESDIYLDNGNGSQGTTPSLSAYFEHHFPHKQTLVVDFGASLYNGHSFSNYRELLPESGKVLTEVSTYITDCNQAYAIEADYIKQWNMKRLTVGATYNANRNRSTYRNLDNNVFHQKQDNTYFFAEYFQRIKNFTLTAGIGTQYSSFHLRESNQGNHSWNLRPKASITYSINSNHRLRLGFSSWQTAPSLAETNIAPQQIDGFQWQIGNPNLKTSNSYMLNLRYSFSFPRVDGTFSVRAFTSPNAVAPHLYWESNRLITTFENSRGLQNIVFNLSPQVAIVPEWLIAAGSIEYRTERMKGSGYSLCNHNWSGNAQLMLTHYGFVLSTQYTKSARTLYGERISWQEDLSIISLSYNWNKWQFGAGMIMPFGKYDQGSRLLNHYNSNVKHMRVNLRIPYISVSYNLQWGRQKRGAQKIIDVDTNADRSTAGGR
ncbi:MAG: outer membrane beta-barrel family protein [Muribaculaceae bacterium]|nr:outer membrane beta-barrel family protein [Muribaculaceae bacterium]